MPPTIRHNWIEGETKTQMHEAGYQPMALFLDIGRRL